MNKVLVTGATGFIGNYVIQQLLNNDNIVIASSLNEEKGKAAEWYNKVKYIPLDFKTFDDKINYFDYFDKPDRMIHLAWAGLPNYKEPFHVKENLPLQSKTQ